MADTEGSEIHTGELQEAIKVEVSTSGMRKQTIQSAFVTELHITGVPQMPHFARPLLQKKRHNVQHSRKMHGTGRPLSSAVVCA